MSEPKWEDVEVGDAVVIESTCSDLTITGTVTEAENVNGFFSVDGQDFYPASRQDRERWTLLDIIKPEPQLPTTPGSLIRLVGHEMTWTYFLTALGWTSPLGRGNNDLRAGVFEVIYDAGEK
jgi:hypothetical protein